MTSTILAKLCDAFFIGFGAWTLLVNACYFSGASFRALVFCGVALAAAMASWIVFDLRRSGHSRSPADATAKQCLLLLLFVAGAMLLTLCLHRPDADDQYYLGRAILLLDHPDLPVKDIPAPRAFRTGYALTSHEALKSAVSQLTQVPILHSYYLIVPAFFSIFIPLVHWRLLRLLIGRGWIAGLVFLFVVMLAWGDVHRTHANFGFVRLFQGKACLVSIVVPALIFYFLRYYETGERRNAVLLFFALIAGIGFSPTGIVVGLLTLLVLLSANLERIVATRRDLLMWSSILIWPVLAGLAILYYFKQSSRGVATTNYEMWIFVMGEGFRGFFALGCFVISPFFVESKTVSRAYGRFVIACAILLLLPWTSQLLGQWTFMTASWRWLWMIPFPAAMSLVVGSVSQARVHGRYPVGYLVATTLALVYVSVPGPLVLSEENYSTRLTWPDFKLADPTRIYLPHYDEIAEIRDGYVYVGKSTRRF